MNKINSSCENWLKYDKDSSFSQTDTIKRHYQLEQTPGGCVSKTDFQEIIQMFHK